jgi:hypothetical protein
MYRQAIAALRFVGVTAATQVESQQTIWIAQVAGHGVERAVLGGQPMQSDERLGALPGAAHGKAQGPRQCAHGPQIGHGVLIHDDLLAVSMA